MPAKRTGQTAEDSILPPRDPRRPLLIRRLSEERSRIADFLSRAPQLEDPEYKEWETSVETLLAQLFGSETYRLRFQRLTIRPISYNIYDGPRWHSDPREAWQTGLGMAGKILDQAIEEARVEFPSEPDKSPTAAREPRTPTVLIQNVFSPTVHVTVSQLLTQLDTLALSASERELAKEQIAELDAETKGAQRWGIIGRHLDAIKAMGKGVYENIAAPLIVEYLKSQMTPPGTLR